MKTTLEADLLAACTRERDGVPALDWLDALLAEVDARCGGWDDSRAAWIALQEASDLLRSLRTAVKKAEVPERTGEDTLADSAAFAHARQRQRDDWEREGDPDDYNVPFADPPGHECDGPLPLSPTCPDVDEDLDWESAL